MGSAGRLLLSQKPYAPVQRAVVRAEEGEEPGRVYVVVNHAGIFTVHDVVYANACRPPIAVKPKLAFHSGVQRKEIREAELPRSGNDLAKLVNGHKAKPETPHPRPRHVKLLN